MVHSAYTAWANAKFAPSQSASMSMHLMPASLS